MNRLVPERSTLSALRPYAWLTALVLATIFLAWFGRDVAPPVHLCPDYICYWATGKIMLSGQSPYDVDLQTRVQHESGWDKQKDGLGAFDFLPYYYPPWFAMLTVALVPLGYYGGKVTWFVLSADLVLLTGYLLRKTIPGVPPAVPLVAIPIFIFTVVTIVIGQTTPLILFLIAVAWRLLEARRDRTAGFALAWLTIKPQLTILVLPGVLLWAARRRRWGVVVGFAATLAVLALASWLLIPGWLGQMLDAPRQTPPPTENSPWIGTTWFLLLKSAGFRSWSFWALYALVAVPLLATVLKTSLDRSKPLHDVLALGLLAACIVAPYGRNYDFPVLLIPLFVLLGTRLSENAGAVLLAALLLLPYSQYWIMTRRGLVGQIGSPSPEFLFAWVPLFLAGVWLTTAFQRSRRPTLTTPEQATASQC